MRFPRNARIFRGRLEAAPFATVFFLLLLFMMLTSLVYTPGVRLELPVASNLPGTSKLTITVAIDANGRLYFENQSVEEADLRLRLRKAVGTPPQPLTLIVEADKTVQYEKLIRLTLLARDAGIQELLLATFPAPLAPPARPASE